MGGVIHAPELPSTSQPWTRAGQALAETRSFLAYSFVILLLVLLLNVFPEAHSCN